MDLARLAESLAASGAGEAEFNGYLLTLKTGPYADHPLPHRAAPWSRGTSDTALARSLYARYVGG